ncbi:hypothetical protein [Arthrobacter sp. A5]|uniref:hypothetical protein n=1 Tax=Arthrobacter sp. A5 TaxID=576926 RepID=UPI003DA80D32
MPTAATNPAWTPAAYGAVLSPGRSFSHTELQAMSLDGVLEPVFGDAYVLSGTDIGPELRGQALALLTPAHLTGRGVACRLSAAWVYGCSRPPFAVSLLVDKGHRAGALPAGTGCILHEAKLSRFDVATIGTMPVTTPLRTAVDLALQVQTDDALQALRAMAADPLLNCPLGLVRQALEARGRVPHKHTALERIRLLLRFGDRDGD